MKNTIREINPDNQQDVATITRLHLKLLWWGPMARLGEIYLRKFCYTTLLQDRLMKAALAEVNGQPAGFIAYTHRSITFHRSAIGKHLGYVTYLTILSIISNPLLIPRIFRAARVMFSRRQEQNLGQDPLAEILAIGVLPEFSNPGFIRHTGLRISAELVNHAASYFRRIGLNEMRMIIDADNRAALLFYHSLGARLEPYEQAGKPMVQAWLDLTSYLSGDINNGD